MVSLNVLKSALKLFLSILFFWTLTIIGNSIMVVGSLALMVCESKAQPRILDYIDYLLWSAGLITTIGYGDYMAHTFLGKIVVLILMLLGTLFIWSYMAFFVTGLFAPELASLEKEFHGVEKEVHDVEKEVHELKENKKRE